MPRIDPLQFLFMPLRRTNPFVVLRHLREAERLGVDISADRIESTMLSGVDPAAVIQAAADAKRRGLPDNIPALVEAAIAGLNLSQFVEQAYEDPELRTMTALRAAATTDSAAAARLADKHLEAAAKVRQFIDGGPQSIGQRLVWKMQRDWMAGVLGQELEAARALLPHLDPGERARVQRALDQAV